MCKKTCVKNIDLGEKKYKLISFLFIKIVIRVMKQNLNLIFLDKSNFLLILF